MNFPISFAEVFIGFAISYTLIFFIYKYLIKETTPKYEITLVCTPEGYRRILASCEVSGMTRTEYFNQALNDIADKHNLPRPDDVTVH